MATVNAVYDSVAKDVSDIIIKAALIKDARLEDLALAVLNHVLSQQGIQAEYRLQRQARTGAGPGAGT